MPAISSPTAIRERTEMAPTRSRTSRSSPARVSGLLSIDSGHPYVRWKFCAAGKVTAQRSAVNYRRRALVQW